MKPESLLASAAINFGLAFIVLSLFSLLKKQPSNAPIYYARRLSRRHRIELNQGFALSRFLPSVSWIPRAFRVTEDEVLQINGLDALLIIRLFKFGIKFFGVCTFVGLVILLPVNYYGEEDSSKVSQSLDSFTISNVVRGSNRLWVHFTCLWFISFYGLFMLYHEYDRIMVKRIQQLKKLRHRPEQFTVLVRQIPFCTQHKAYGCSVDHFFLKYHPNSYHSHKMLYDGKKIEDLLDKARYVAKKIEQLKETCILDKHKSHCSFLPSYQDDVKRLNLLQSKLNELLHLIRQSEHEDVLKEKELPVAFATFISRSGAAIVSQSQQHSHPLQWITEMAPEPRDVSWKNLAVPLNLLPLYKITIVVFASLLTIFFVVPVTTVQGIAKYEKIKKWFPPAMAIELIPGLSSVLTGYLPSAILKGFIYIVPFAMLGLAKISGSVSKSKEEIKACNMVFYFLVGNVFFLSLVSGSLLDEIGESFIHPKNFPSHLASAVSAQADFFVTYILTDGLSGFSLEILQPGLLLWDMIMSRIFCQVQEENAYLYSLPYFRIIPTICLSILIGMVYAIVSPILLPCLIGYFCLGYVVFINQIEDVYETIYETCGQYWPYIHHYLFVSIILMQITMIGLFGLKSKPAASIATIPLFLFTILFNEYCKIRFLPTFRHYPIQDAADNDELDRKNGTIEINYENASDAYRAPSIQPLNLKSLESSLTQPLIASSPNF